MFHSCKQRLSILQKRRYINVLLLEVIRDCECVLVKVVRQRFVLGHPKGVDVHAKLMNLGRPWEERCCLVHLRMLTLRNGTVTFAPLWLII